jgi:hypothetical protein
MRERVQRALAPLPLEYVVDEVARRFGLTGSGYLRLKVRDGFVVGGEYGWLADELILKSPEDEQSLEELDEGPFEVVELPKGHSIYALSDSGQRHSFTRSRHEGPFKTVVTIEGRSFFALNFRQRRSFTGSVPPELRSR